jgi:hypothetical protein
MEGRTEISHVCLHGFLKRCGGLMWEAHLRRMDEKTVRIDLETAQRRIGCEEASLSKDDYPLLEQRIY